MADPVAAVEVPPAAGALDGAWRLLVELATTPSAPRWVLIGGMLVELHAHERGVAPPRATVDADVLVDVRTDPGGTATVATWLTDRGLVPDTPGYQAVAHRFRRDDGVVVDLLAPDHLGERADLTTVAPAQTVPAVAGRRLTAAAQPVRVTYRGQAGVVQRPPVAATLVGKCRAYQHDRQVGSDRPAERHLDDAVLLLSLLADPRGAVADLSRRDRRCLARLRQALPPEAARWAAAPAPDEARAALALLAQAAEGG